MAALTRANFLHSFNQDTKLGRGSAGAKFENAAQKKAGSGPGRCSRASRRCRWWSRRRTGRAREALVGRAKRPVPGRDRVEVLAFFSQNCAVFLKISHFFVHLLGLLLGFT